LTIVECLVVDRKQIIKVVIEIKSKITGCTGNWAVTGSASLVVRGISNVANDIDIICNSNMAHVFSSMLSVYVHNDLSYSENGNIRSLFSSYKIDGVEIEIMADISNRLGDGVWYPNSDWSGEIEVLDIDELSIPVMNLEYEKRMSKALGNHERFSILNQY